MEESPLLFDKNTWPEIGLPTCYMKPLSIYQQKTPPKKKFTFQLHGTAFYFSFSVSLFLFLFSYFSFSTCKTLLLEKRRDDAYIFKGRAQMPKTMMPEQVRKLTCRYPPKMLHQWKKKNEHGRYPLASVNEIAKNENTKIRDIFGEFFGRHFSSRPPGFHRTFLGRHVFQTVRCWSQEAEDVA